MGSKGAETGRDLRLTSKLLIDSNGFTQAMNTLTQNSTTIQDKKQTRESAQ